MKDIDPDNNYIPKIEKKLQQVMGLNAASVGMPVVIRAVEQRMKSLKMTAIVRYYNLLIDSTAEMKELIENVIIPETWFFRDKTPFDALKKYIRDQWKPANPNKAVQILSIPCSTGEEPYTIAMSLMDIGMKSSEFRIDGIDISRENLIKANNGSYTRNSFRGDNISFKDRY
ncbi:MAG: chemotaxis protein CheR, partial [Methylococcales bacterium]|nr:chemotaxis protein CheR [Methylococcales bacterium]